MRFSNAISVSSIARMMYGRAKSGERILAVLGAFFDDSGTHDGSPFVVIGGLLGTEDQWDQFEKDWSYRLQNPIEGKPPLEYFHLTECRMRLGQFRDYNEAEKDHIIYLFRKIILDLNLITFAVAVDQTAWDQLIVGEVKKRLGPSEGACFSKCIDAIIELGRRLYPNNEILFFFDEGRRENLEGWANLYKSQTDKYPEIGSITFAPVKKVVALQGADMIANETYRFAQEWSKDRNDPKVDAHFKSFMKRDLSAGLVIGREQIEEIIPIAQKLIQNRA